MHTPAEFFDPVLVQCIKLLLATMLGGVIGTERAILAKQAAGMRTFSLVALGACAFVLVGNYANTAYLGVVNFNPTQLAAAIITGIGFLGGGLIIFRHDSLHGITTAAGLWITAAIGMSVGFGMYAMAVFATILALAVLTALWYVENRFKHWFEDRQETAHGESAPAL